MAKQKPEMEVVGRLDVSKEAGPPRWDPETAAPALSKGAEAMQAGDLDAAHAAFEEARSLSVHDPRPLGGLALIAMQRENWKVAVERGRAASLCHDAGYEIFYNLGFSLLQLGKRDDALLALQQAFQRDPTQPHAIHQLVRNGRIPKLEGQEELVDPQPLDTLTRLELYDSVGRAVVHGDTDGTFRHTVEWAIDRGAPWGQIAAWLAGQGVHDDATLIEVLSARDAHLADSWVSGFLIASGPELKAAAARHEDFALLTENGAVNPDGAILFGKLDADGSRAVLPPQRTSAAHVVGLAQHLFPMLGPKSALVITVDPASHLGPRRLWIVTPASDHEVVGIWKGTLADGSEAPAQAVPDERAIPANASPLYVPGTDQASLQALIDEHMLQDVVRAVQPDGMAEVQADKVQGFDAAWSAFLARVAELVPPGSAVLPRWREGTKDLLAICRPGTPLEWVTLKSVWPPHQEDLGDQVPMEIQFLGRALFQGPRPRGASST